MTMGGADPYHGAGGFLIIGWEGAGFEEPLGLLEEFRPTGLILFRRNYPGSPEALRAGLAALKGRASDLGIEPLILTLDDEGGLVKRLPEPFVQLPKARECADPLAIRTGAKRAALELRDAGFNLNLAPVLDVDVLGGFMRERCFGTTPEDVAQRAFAFVQGFRDGDIGCCGKHFPGLGAATLDPHERLPVVDLDGDELERVHAAPFRKLAAYGLSAIMTTHCRYPAWDPENMATFSATIVGRIRPMMGFRGPILSDDLEMGAVVEGLSVGQAALAAIEAGHDLALVCRKRDNIEAAARSLGEALADGRLDRARLLASRRRAERALGMS
jgi:beta-N-acetylhexosaminidase